MLDIMDAEIYLGDGCHKMHRKDSTYEFDGIRAAFADNGLVTVTGSSEELYFLKVSIENTYFNDALVLGDAWERGYGDFAWKKPVYSRKMPWYFLACENGAVYGFGVKTQPNAMCFWQCDKDKITLTMDLRNGSGGTALLGRSLEVCRIVYAEFNSGAYEAARSFCKIMCDEPRLPKRPVFGGNDWYCNYGDNSYEKIISHTKKLAECAKGCRYKPYMVIDDGWELCHHKSEDDSKFFNGGPWKYCNANFKDMKKTAQAVEEAGAIPGIWFRPLWTVEKFPDEYILKADGIRTTLDPSVPEVLEIIQEDVKQLCRWGYKLIKHDFSTWDIFGSWGFEMKEDMYKDSCSFFDKTKTTAEIIKNMYRAIREAAGDDVIIIGCNTVSHLAAGFFEIQRTGDDTSGVEWERTKKMGVNTLAFRMCQHNTFYAHDADCVGITKKIAWDKNRQWLDILAKSSTPLFVSIADDAFCDEVKADICRAFEEASGNEIAARPLDWFDTAIPQKWLTAFGEKEYTF